MALYIKAATNSLAEQHFLLLLFLSFLQSATNEVIKIGGSIRRAFGRNAGELIMHYICVIV